MGAYLYASRVRSKAELSRFLITRGVWLIILDWTVVRFGLDFGFHWKRIFLLVLWSIGCSMICLAGLIWSPLVIAGFGMTMIVVHNAFDGVRAEDLGVREPLACIT